MHIKFGAHDRGSGAGAIAYLKGLRDSKGHVRAGIEVLRGNPEQTAQLIDSLKTSCKYSSAVIAWHKEDDPTTDEIESVVDDFERVAFAGLRKSQYMHCAVLHTEDDGSKHVHIIVPRVCLESGRSINVAPPGHKYYFAKWRNVWNFEKGWARPDDPTRARLVQPGKKSYLPADELRSRLDKPTATDSKVMITEWLTAKITAGELVNRTDILEALHELVGDFGEITRVGKDYVSVRLAEGAKPLRLKGLLYGDNFSPELINSVAAAQAARPAGRAKPDIAAARDAREQLEIAVRSRTSYNIERYSKPTRSINNSVERRSDSEHNQRDADKRVAQAVEFRSKYIDKQQKRQDQEITGRPRQLPEQVEHQHHEAHAVADVMAHGNDDPSLLGDDWISNALELVHREQSQQSSGANPIRSTEGVKADEQRILQPTNKQEVLPLIIAKNYPTIIAKNYKVDGSQNYPIIIAKNYNVSGYKLNMLNGENNNGLYKPDVRSPAAWPIYQHAARFSSLQTLSRSNMDAIRERAAMLLPAAARGHVVARTESSTGAVRRTNSVSGTATEAKGGLGNDPVRNAIDKFIATVDRLTHAASESVKRCIATTIRAVQQSDSSVVQCTAATTETNSIVNRTIDYVNKNSNGVRQYMDDEMDRFKKEISLFDLAQNEFGYEFIADESSKSYFVMRKGKGDKIIITTDKRPGRDPHDVYINTGDKSDSGSIIDFVKNRVGDNNIKLVRVRQLLRPWAPGAKKPAQQKPQTAPVRPIPIKRDIAAVVAEWTAMKPYSGSYLTKVRRLDPAIIKAFDVRQDPEHGNACFKHRKPGEGVVGYESKNAPAKGQTKTFTGFATGGEKALFIGRLDDLPVSRLVVVEAAIDALSYAQLHHKPGTVYISTGGSMSEAQTAQLKTMIAANPKAVLVLATDNDLTDKHNNALSFYDRPGEKLAKDIAAMAPAGMVIERDTPIAKDWNKDLQNMAEAQEQQQAAARIREALQNSQQTYQRGG